ncbi:MAG TPA: carboxypeptidase M32 [Bacilli bacterium]|nr:carboxypeptidase M32 [Bacilli bacterium]
MSNLQTQVQEFQAYVKRMKHLEEAANLIYWDLRTGCPKKGVPQRSETVGMLSTDLFKMSISEEMGRMLDALSASDVLDQLDPITRASVLERKKDYDLNRKIPTDKYQEYVVLCSQAEHAWQEAKANNDFDNFAPYMEKIVATLREFIEIWGYEENKYDALLDQYEPGMTVSKIDAIFQPLREGTVALLKQVKAAQAPDKKFLDQEFPKAQQREFSEFILREIGYDFDAGRLDESAHPFASGLNPGDVRVTTRFLPNDFQSALFGTIHECGHALYEQNLSHDLLNTFLCTGTSMGIHESQSRFWENMIGRSQEFWSNYYEKLKEKFPQQFEGVGLEDFYKAINTAEPSLIRTEADELTYNLHIMIRYEIEKDLINGKIEVRDLPRVWNEKMEEYLGITPPNHTDGVLQDIHWSGGAFGYFPSYTLGNIYAAMFENTLRKEIPDYKAQVARGDMSQVKAWLTEKVYRHGKSKLPKEIMVDTTGEEINSEYLLRYLEDKYKAVYGI